MTVKFSTALRDGLLVDDSLKAHLEGKVIRLYGGPVPTSADASIGSATLLVEISKDGDGSGISFEPTPEGGGLEKAMAESWFGTVVADGQATFYRIVSSVDDDTATTTAIRLQGELNGQDGLITNPNLTTSSTQTIDHANIKIPTQVGTFSISEGLRDHLLVTGSLKDALDGLILRVYEGTVPASATASIDAATSLIDYSVDGDGTGFTFDPTPVNGALVKDASETWQGEAYNSGTAHFYRLLDGDTDDGSESSTAIRVQGRFGGMDGVLSDNTIEYYEVRTMPTGRITLPLG